MRCIQLTLFTVLTVGFMQNGLAQSGASLLSEDGALGLHIPMLGTAADPGRYQNIKLRSDGSERHWTLESGEEAFRLNSLNSVVMVKTSEHPVQVFLKVSGYRGACARVGQHVFVMQGSAFNTFLYQQPDSGRACVDSVELFEKVIPLPVYGLAAGDYSYSVNGALHGKFTLTRDNILE